MTLRGPARRPPSRWGWLAAASTIALAVGGPLGAQAPRWVVDVNASRVRYDSAAALNAPGLSSRLEWRRPSTFARIAGGVTTFEGAGWSMQGRGDLAGWISPLPDVSLLRVELTGSGGASRHSSDFHSLVGRADLRVHAAGPDLGAWIGAGGTIAKNSYDSTAVDAFVPSLGVWGRTGPVRVTATYAHTLIARDAFPEANAVASLSQGSLDLDVYAGVRRYPFDAPDRTESWVGATAAWWFGNRAAVVVSGGQYATDVLQGLPGGDFVSIGFRLARRRVPTVPRRFVVPFVYTAEDADGEVGVAFRLPDATRAEIAGDFNGWQPEPLTRGQDGRWTFPTELAPGVYRFNVRIDGQGWIVPEDFPEVDDGFGSKVGLLIVSDDAGEDGP